MMREFDKRYLLRVWKDGKGEDAWRASLKDLRATEGQEPQVFKSLTDLLSFIQRVQDGDAEPPEAHL
jgi:hypothetical protein